MKLGLIFSAVIFGLFLGTGIALATTGTHHVEAPIVVPQDRAPATVELPQDTVITVAPITVYGKVPSKHSAPRAKQWVCGEMHDNAVGGRNRDCEWR